ncbi:MAG: haloacid dehalogenase type II [Chloroflexi bacterium]|nr:haloacid dehalogenase type II [Chloroflexota bacterium]MCI0857584.1 haloacid dehalogenase type II [Chloroflexota bacterium]MCI0896227.1 haloacid dehalogenase type II [Chloroflexota bacterium]
MDSSNVKALIFDVFGTVVDWRTSIIRQGKQFGKDQGVKADWEAFADSWRGKYRPFMDKVRTGELPWTNLDGLHRMALEEVLTEFEIYGISEEAKAEFNLSWHRLDPWPDSVPGLYRLKRRFIVAPMSNGNLALMTNMAKNGGLPWDCILGAELAKHYKPDPESYQTAVDLLGLKSEQVMMVAAHQGDLLSAQKIGLKSAFVPRPMERGPNNRPDPTPDPSFDVVANDFVDLADRLGS